MWTGQFHHFFKEDRYTVVNGWDTTSEMFRYAAEPRAIDS